MEKENLMLQTNSKKMQLTPPGEYGFRYECVRMLLGDGWYITPHWHQYHEIIIIEEGDAIVTVGNRTEIVTKGQGFAVNSNRMHEIVYRSNGNGRGIMLRFHSYLIFGIWGGNLHQKYVVPLESEAGPDLTIYDSAAAGGKIIWDAILRLSDMDTQLPRYELMVRHEIEEIWLALMELNHIAPVSNSPKSRDKTPIEVMLQYIYEHYTDNITIDTLMRVGGVSKTECHRLFRNSLDTTPIAYINQYRIERSMDLITGSDAKIADIAMSVGFESLSSFMNAFKKVYSVTPSELRKGTRDLRQAIARLK